MLDHVAGVFGLAGLVIVRLQSCERKHFGGVVEFAEVAEFRKDDGGGKLTDAGQREDRRVNTAHALFDLV